MKSMTNKKKINGNTFLLFITIALFVVMYIIGIILFGDRGFARMQTFMNMLLDNAGLIIAAAGMTIILITGGIDISVGSVVGLVCMMLAFFMENMQMNVWLAIFLVLFFGVVFGAVQGWLSDGGSIPEDIEYEETRTYLTRVLNALDEYRRNYPLGVTAG